MNILDPIPLAGIHVTILSIFFAVVVAYLLFIYSTTEQMILQAIQKIDDEYDCMGFIFYAGGSVTGDNTNPEELARQFRRLIHMSGKDKWQEALHILSILAHIYPFSEKMEIKPGGGILITRPEPKPLVSNLKEAQRWVETMRCVEKQLEFLYISQDRQKFQEVLDTYYDSLQSMDEKSREYWKGVAEEQREDFSKYLQNHPELSDAHRAELSDRIRKTSEGFEAIGKYIPIRISADEIYSRFRSVFQVANNVCLNLNRMKDYKQSNSMTKLRYFFVSAGIIFLTGVVLPIALNIYASQNHLVIKIVIQACSFWIPVILYTLNYEIPF